MKTFEEAFSERRLGDSNLSLKNIFIRSATYEGMFDQGIPTQQLIDHHVAMAKGEVALTTVSYGAVSVDGRTFIDQMYIHDQSLKELKVLAQEVHLAGGKVSIQLTHCGYFSKNKEVKSPIAPSRVFNEYGSLSGIFFSRAMSLEDMEQVSNEFAEAAQGAREAGKLRLEGKAYIVNEGDIMHFRFNV